MQITKLHQKYDELQLIHGDAALTSIYGAGCVEHPKVMFIFMNPTGRNISASKSWNGLRAPWLGTKIVWNIFYDVGFISLEHFTQTQSLTSKEWTESFAKSLYSELAENRVFITNLAKCTQIDARPLKDSVFKDYLELMKEEISAINPEKIITFGNQVSSILLNTSISVSNYLNNEHETIEVDTTIFPVYPVHYPVGQGLRNMPLSIRRIRYILGV